MEKFERHIVTQEDLDNNSNLEKQGIQVGDEVEVPMKEDDKAPEIQEDQVKPSSDPPTGEIKKSAEGVYEMTRTVKYNAKIYNKGDKIDGSDECAQIFLQNGYMK